MRGAGLFSVMRPGGAMVANLMQKRRRSVVLVLVVAALGIVVAEPTDASHLRAERVAYAHAASTSSVRPVGPLSISCASTSLCVAVDGAGDVLSSSNPAGGSGAWTMINVDGTTPFRGVSCPSLSLCVAVDAAGNVVTSTDPTGGAPSLSTSGETLTIEESMTLRAGTENAGHVGDEYEWRQGSG